jgi:predicted glycoside hydrolase/deacetylase ChbG (UPF0249 family)
LALSPECSYHGRHTWERTRKSRSAQLYPNRQVNLECALALGFEADARVVVVHADDIGMCHATLPAIDELMAFGSVTSASVMVPCPWFLEAASWHRRNPQFDLGIHLTLTSEWPHYRWGALSCRDEESGLLDEQGYFHGATATVRRQAKREAVRVEMRRQIDLALRAGIDASHIDTHMLVALCDEFLEIYLEAGQERGVPAFLARDLGHSAEAREWFQRRGAEWDELGQPVFDHCRVVTRRGDGSDHLEFVADVFDRLPAGLSCVLLHPAIDTLELRGMTSEWRGRVADFETFRRASLRDHIRDLGIHLISYRPICDAMRRRLRAGPPSDGRQPSTTDEVS